jgi:eukaryotic-like serine/threonine-protein kinase
VTDKLVGQIVEDRYRIEAALGAGGMGAVYRARHIKVGREVAIKVLHEGLLTDPVMVERFEREAGIAARLHHKNLNPVIDVGETATKQKLMVLELVRGDNLATILGNGPLAPARAIELTLQILDGLEHAHAAGLVHRDLKPENIIIEVDGGGEVPKIVDFGIAMLCGGDDRRLTAAGIVMGTPQYMAPEHSQGSVVDPRCDLFALGVIVYEMLAGKLPFDGTGVEIAIANISKAPPAIARRAPGVIVDPRLEAFVRRLMARRLADRFQTAGEARAALARIAQDARAPAGLVGMVPLAKPAPTVPLSVLARASGPDIPALADTLEAPKPPPSTRRPTLPWHSYAVLALALATAIIAVLY